jgi:hypothetical protein
MVMKKYIRTLQKLLVFTIMLGVDLNPLNAMEEKQQAVGAELTSGDMNDLDKKAKHRHEVRLHTRKNKGNSVGKPGGSQDGEEKMVQANSPQASEEELKQAIAQAEQAKEFADKNLKKLVQKANDASRHSAKNPEAFRKAVDAADEAQEEVDRTAVTKAQAVKQFADYKLAQAQQKQLDDEVQAAEKEVKKADLELAHAVKKVADTKVRKTSREEVPARKQRAASEWFAPEKYRDRRGSEVIYDQEKHKAALKAQENARRESDEADKQLKEAEEAAQ